MEYFKTAYLEKYDNETHYEFDEHFISSVNASEPVRKLLEPQMLEYVPLFTEESELYDRMVKSNITELLTEAAKKVDINVQGIRTSINAASFHYDPAKVEAARILGNRMKSLGKIERKAYEAESAAVEKLINDFKSPEYVNQVETVGITQWVDKLATAKFDFEVLFDRRNIERSKKPEEPLRNVKRKINKLYHIMTDRVDAAATLDTEGIYTDFIKQWNVTVEYYNTHIHHHAKVDIDVTTADYIAPQTATGKEITPIPTVHDGDKELVFTRDFYLAYRKNILPGDATIIIHGKGAYKGKKIITFNIVE